MKAYEIRVMLIEFAEFLEQHGAENLTNGIEPYADEFAKRQVKKAESFEPFDATSKSAPTYAQWINKYFTWYRNDDLYKEKRSGKVYYQLELYNRYKKAYKG